MAQMTRDLIIGIDAGTSVMKAVAFTIWGEQIAMTARPNAYATPGHGPHLGRLRGGAARIE
jgi:erythritol kinase (D-erythritol 1-phosphate-forming)